MQRSSFVPGLLALAVSLTLTPLRVGASEAPGTSAPERSAPTAGLRVASYNANYGLRADRSILAAIVETDADVVLLQESTPELERAVRRGLAKRYPHVAFVRRGAAGGLATLSRYPLRESETLPPPGEGWFPAQRVVVETPLGPVQLLNVHLRPPISDGGSLVSGYFTTGSVRAEEIRAHHARLHPELPTLVAGDFNESSGSALDFLEGLGFANALHDMSGYTPTWRWPTSVGDLSAQLDHVLHDDRLAPKEARVLQAGRSDHLPVVVVFALPHAKR